jgi:murein DD-endopeptidase MepM/ murein hydrolase activator NlpD
MTPFLQRTVLILLGTSAICAGATSAHAQLFKPNYPIRLPAAEAAPVSTAPVERASASQDSMPRAVRSASLVESQGLQPAVSRGEPAPQLILAATRHRSAAPKGPPATVTVKKGDTLDAIADRLDVTVEQLKATNGLKRNTIQPGVVLKNPKAAEQAPAKGKGKGSRTSPPEEPAPAAEPYTVRRGDTIFSISKKLGVSMDTLREANGLSSRAQIHTGQKLKVSADTGAADAQAAEEMARQGSKARRSSTRSRSDEAADIGEGRSARGRVVTVAGQGTSYTVRRGDNLAKIADKLNTTVDALKKDNRLKSSTLRPGKVLRGPAGAPSKAYVAASGDSLDEVAQRFGVTTSALRSANGLSRRATIKPGQRLRLPAGYRDRGPIRASTPEPIERMRPSESIAPHISPPPTRNDQPRDEAPRNEAPREESIALPSQPQPYTPSPSTPRPRGYVAPGATPALPLGTAPPAAPQTAAPVTDAQVSAMGRGKFIWPLRGEILSEFGPKAGGQRNDGVNIQAQAGDAVRAAAAGDVVYAGDQVPGFGNVVLIKHPEGWVTVYGHLSRVDVKMQQKVTQGQQVGQAGSTGGMPEPQVHFEVRYTPAPMDRARPIDPRLVLPR